MKILVTGGAGFIGSHIVDTYIKAGHKVVVIDDLSKGLKENINKKAKFYKADIRDFSEIKKIIKKEKPVVLSHFAALAEVAKSLVDPLPTVEVNVLGTINLLRAFGEEKNKNKKFIFASTGGAIYGDPQKLPADEKTNVNPLSPYGLSKLQAEEAIKMYAQMYDFSYFIFRFANVYGPRQNSNGEAGVVPIFANLMKAGKRPTIYGDGSKTRDYVFVSDIASANLSALKKGNNETINLGTGKQITDNQVYNEVSANLNFTGKPIYVRFRKGEITHISLDSKNAKKILGWSPKVSFNKGIQETLKSL